MLNDCRIALRVFLHSPGFAIVAILSLALGIGANTAIFSLLDQALLRSLPVSDPERIVAFDSPGPSEGSSSSDANLTVFSAPFYRQFRDRNKVFSGVVARSHSTVGVLANEQTEMVEAEVVSGNFFDVLGLKPVLGRTFLPSEDAGIGSGPVVVLGHGLWTRRFGADRSVIGKTIRINNFPMTVIGVAAPGFRGMVPGNSAELFVPMSAKLVATPIWPKEGLQDPRVHWLNIFARLSPGVTSEQAAAAMQPVYRTMLIDDLATIKRTGRFAREYLAKPLRLVSATQGINQLRDDWGKPLIVLMALVGLVLLIACANVANLLIARAAGRRREIAIRLAIGADRWILVRQLLTESLMLSLAGGVLGLLVCSWTVALLLRLLPQDTASAFLSSSYDGRILLFNFALAIVTGVLFGLVPALQATNTSLASTLKDQSAAVTAGRGQAHFRRILVAGQIALSLLLLIASGLFARSLANLMSHNPGFHVENLTTLAVRPVLSGYSPERGVELERKLSERFASLPGVIGVSGSGAGVFTGSDMSSNVTVEGYTAREDENMNVNRDTVMPQYFSAMGIRLLDGREFNKSDGPDAPKVVIVNESFARAYFQGKSPVGRWMRFGAGNGKPDRQIVGLVSDSESLNLRDKIRRFVYVPYLQEASAAAAHCSFYIRSSNDPESLFPSLRAAVRQVDSNMPIEGLRSVRVQIDDTVSSDRLVATLSLAIGVLATLLAAVGLYGLISYNVQRRTAEIGVRIALGADRRNVLKLVMREVILLAGIGLGVGIPLALALSSYVESQLFGLKGRDPMVFLFATVTLLIIAVLAGYFPASRAMRIDPIRALRYE